MARQHQFAVPDGYAGGLLTLGALTEQEMEALVAVLTAQPPTADLNELLTLAVAALPEQQPESVGRMINALLAIEQARQTHGWSNEQLAEGLSMAGNLDADDETISLIADRVAKCVAADSLVVVVKAEDLPWADPNTLSSVRIVTDIRPIFVDDPKQRPVGSTLVHHLEIVYYRDDGRLRTFYVALDDYDLDRFVQVIGRAQDKAATLQALLERAGLTPTVVGDTSEE